MASALKTPAIQKLPLTDFSGGLNTRDSPNEIALSETPDALNWTLDERGALKLRKGIQNQVTLPGTSLLFAFIFYSAALDQWLCARATGSNQAELFTRPGDLSGSWTSRGSLGIPFGGFVITNVAFVDFPGNPPKVVIASANADPGSEDAAIATWDGTTLSVITTTIGGQAIALWEDRVWIAGYPKNDANGNLSRLFYSKRGDPTNWTPPDGGFTDIRIKDAAQLTALGVAAGALIVFKNRSAYRVADSTTGFATLIDSSSGAQGPRAVVPLAGRLYSWGADSLYEFDGIGPGRRVGDKARPVFLQKAQTMGGLPGMVGGTLEGKVVFAYGTNVNDELLEYDPEHNWIMRHKKQEANRRFSSFATKGTDLYGAEYFNGQLVKMFSGTPGADTGGVFLLSNYRTPWLQPHGGRLCRILKAQVEGILVTGGTNTLKLRVYKDWDLSSFDEYDLSADLRAGDANDQQETAIVDSLGHARSFAFEFVAGTAAGDAAVRLLTLDWVPLER